MLLTLLLACTDTGTPKDSTVGETGDSADSGGSLECPAGSHLDGETCVATLVGWTEGPALDSGRDHHLTLLHEVEDHAVVLVLAGTTARGRVNQQVERARLDAEGTLGEFEVLDDWEGAAIGQGLGLGATSAVVVGGLDDTSNSVSNTYVMTLDAEGAPSFVEGPPLVESRYHATATVYGGYVYVMGGMNQVYTGDEVSQTVLDTVERAPFDGTTLGEFETLSTLSASTTHHAVWVWGTGLYLAGGGNSARARDTVQRAELNADGTLGEWVEVGTLPEARATSAATVFLGQVYLVAGMAKLTGEERDTVLRADLNEDGSLGAFEELEALPSARAHAHQAPLWSGWMVSAGGSISHAVQDQVYVGRLE